MTLLYFYSYFTVDQTAHYGSDSCVRRHSFYFYSIKKRIIPWKMETLVLHHMPTTPLLKTSSTNVTLVGKSSEDDKHQDDKKIYQIHCAAVFQSMFLTILLVECRPTYVFQGRFFWPIVLEREGDCVHISDVSYSYHTGY